MRAKARRTKFSADSMSPNRPVRHPRETEARLALARELCRWVWGVDEARAMRLLHLPLMDVALEGQEGVAIAEARDWRRAA